MKQHVKIIGLILCIIMLATGVAGCSDEGADETPSPSPTASAVVSPPKTSASPQASPTAAATSPAVIIKQRLVIGMEEDGYTREGVKANVCLYPVNTNVFEPLVKLGPNFEVLPNLATEWEYMGDNVWRFHLRRGVKFHDGRDFTAEAVAYTMKRIADQGGGTIKMGPDSVKIVDDYTVDIASTIPNMRLPQQLVHSQFGILAPGTDLISTFIGTGPFKFKEYTPNQHLTVIRNPDYWGQKAILEEIRFDFIPDRNTRVMALQAGDCDVIIRVPMESVDLIESTKGLKIARSSPGAYTSLMCNVSGDSSEYNILKDRKVRKAIAQAIDRESIITYMWEKNAELNQTMIPPSVLGEYASLVKGFTYDPEAAKSLLEEAGWKVGKGGIREKDGRRLSLTLVSGFPTAEVHRPIPEILQAQLKEIGIELKIIEVSETAAYTETLKSEQGDIWIEMGNQNNCDPTFLPYLLHHSNGYYSLTYGLYKVNETFDGLLDQALQTSDPDECARLTAEALHILIDEEAINIPIASHYQIWGLRENVMGFTPYPSRINQYNWNEVYLK